MYSNKWEKVSEIVIEGEFKRFVDRLQIHGGWLVNSATTYKKSQVCESMVFVPDPNYEWEIEEAKS